MSEVNTQRGGARQQQARRGFFGRIALFIAQVLDELRKVVRPTRDELVTYTTVVMVFVIAIMLFCAALDYGIGKLVFWAFAGS
ncbi:preprotein translocase subunit SecE [Arsenicicoccus sp. oral taxon 190]|uniref:preprotein translocase subunit SecE n=1 Tax=Arsenicicoccus sp. oral taxon 190 TaxID=1658671 RepID=UPI00067A1FF1|nr:preprotein translocase subunit SecE [Arsenicicoccus sp. oral taxon 190]AKT51265.1 preprotein translocase subunit SecE [Arsenicicoccus sp. oral taxon 190]